MENQIENLINQITLIYQNKKVTPKYLKYLEDKNLKEELEDAPETVKKVVKACEELGIRQYSGFIHVESDYYDWELQRRALRVLAPSKEHMCKTVVMENTRCSVNDMKDPLNSKYYAVCVQYTSKLNTQKLMNFVRSLKNKTISKKHYNFRLASPEKSAELTGFDKNGVCPIGTVEKIPVIITEEMAKLDPPIFYLGAGDVDWKWRISIDAFIKATNCWVVDLS
ncbi:YbaK/ProRS associated domain-containing protein [Neocallimastix lanati (nom. inval.)]|jgi:prolyl-tRNA editing enzyme YbaK/EbsC (Cys-tRNA(Pro) deacylase)|uniref:YbaK/ProRS associated domain-containing protein n=1 Tax=Neocallimastix californiae TaxID=1754190 RepID=A0A1Y2DRG8_9FUNG|nr:YbaK/ProRS associated domain-containing protein [Neocallimastix sp. JGI-2020a]ORY61870.1 YbaK/ProRS associated domain-containing protein [Neocallimastix californiae]|eukprot:ORY61870.1 YbaK/ProRS associated domain-containing protein [Neocallimastix californiae]